MRLAFELSLTDEGDAISRKYRKMLIIITVVDI